MKTGRNDPCHCGSGKKYKKCCIVREPKVISEVQSGRFYFSPGSYGDTGDFRPSIACKKSNGKYHFVLVKSELSVQDEDEACGIAEGDIHQAFGSSGTGDLEKASALKEMGYINVQNFNIVGAPK